MERRVYNAPEGLTSTLRLVANYWDNLAYAALFGSSKRTAAVQAFARKHVLSSKTVRFVGEPMGMDLHYTRSLPPRTRNSTAV